MWRFLQVENDFEIIPFDETQAREVRIPTKPASNSNRKPATDSDPKPATVPI
jgi:hypothetical protein